MELLILYAHEVEMGEGKVGETEATCGYVRRACYLFLDNLLVNE